MQTDERFVLDRHTTDPFYCWRVFDTALDRPHGFGLTITDARRLQSLLENEHAKDPL